MHGFRKFVLRGNLIDLAVAVVVGVAFNQAVHALINDLVTPLIAAVGGQPDFAGLSFRFHNSTFKYGDVINNLLSFFVVAGTVYYLVVLPAERLAAISEKAAARSCPECLGTIPSLATRCMYCTSTVTPAAVPGQRQAQPAMAALRGRLRTMGREPGIPALDEVQDT